MAHEQILSGECDGCGHPLVETTDPENQRAYHADSLVCFSCEQRERAADQSAEESRESGFRSFGVKWFVRRISAD